MYTVEHNEDTTDIHLLDEQCKVNEVIVSCGEEFTQIKQEFMIDSAGEEYYSYITLTNRQFLELVNAYKSTEGAYTLGNPSV